MPKGIYKHKKHSEESKRKRSERMIKYNQFTGVNNSTCLLFQKIL